MLISISGNSKLHEFAAAYGITAANLNTDSKLDATVLDFLTGIGLTVRVNDLIYEEGQEPVLYVDPLSDVDESDEEEEDDDEY